MPWCLHDQRRDQRSDTLSRFDPRYWTVDFPRPMMAAAVAMAPDGLRVDTVFYRADDLAGLIWESADRHDHPLLRYATVRDYRDCRLRFRWRSGGIKPLDARHGPTLTIEGRDETGKARAWYVRLWNYATGTPEDAEIVLDFAALAGGFRFPENRDPVWAGDVDRMFVSLVAPGYDAGARFLDQPQEGWVEMTDIACDGPGAVIDIGAAVLPEQGFGIASGYDDSYHLTPQRLLRNMLHLGYRGDIVHYVGMSHYFRLERSGEGLYASLTGGVLNVASAAWHRGFARDAKALGYGLIWSLSYELFDAHCWGDWKQRAADGAPALTGWEPPSTLLSPAHSGAMAYLQAVARAFLAIGQAAGLAPKFQVGEPWWWVRPSDGAPCLYDGAAVAAFAPVPMSSINGAKSQAQRDTLDRAGACLAASTAALCAAAKGAAPGCVTHLLTYLPTVLDRQAPEAQRANMPVGWASPAFDVLQLEDYDWVTAGDTAATRQGVALAEARLGYPPARQHYLSGFVLRADQRQQWGWIADAAQVARERGVAATYLWAIPQVMRDGFVCWEGEGDMQAFDDVLVPLALGREAEVTPGFSTAILTSAGGREARNAAWAEARTTYDVGPGIRSAEDIAALLGFFRARMGPARGFRLRDPFDSVGIDEALGMGDGITRRFALVRHYGDQTRRITRPVAGSVSVKVAGQGVAGFGMEPGGWLLLDTAPAAGAVVTASFTFDVPVRFAEDRLSATLAGFQAGAAPSVPLVEVREA
ncbi:TIGR02217 family protein [uncultured Sphingomonas sp.]|uniref:phage distal tail protein, Rcc01695 family n=1 Tax=uncultured Sphingomonas sp. TaxID=158754 RepID=UPI003748CF83